MGFKSIRGCWFKLFVETFVKQNRYTSYKIYLKFQKIKKLLKFNQWCQINKENFDKIDKIDKLVTRSFVEICRILRRVVSYEENRKLAMYGLAGLAKKDVSMNFKSYYDMQVEWKLISALMA